MRPRNRCHRLLPSVVVALTVCLAPLPALSASPVVVTDAGGRKIEISDGSRVAAIGGDITEIVYALGAEARLVAIDSTSQFPPAALRTKKNVGYMRAISTEGVLSVGATLIIASERAGPPDVVKALKATSTPYVEIRDEFNTAGITEKVRLIARALDLPSAGERLAASIEAAFKKLDSARASIVKQQRALFVLSVQNARAVVGGRETSADAVLRLAGLENAATSMQGFKPVADEALAELAPDIVVTMRRGAASGHGTDEIRSLNGFRLTPAGASNRVVEMDGLYLLGFGPRAPAAALELMRAAYPEITAAPMGAVR